MTATVIVRHVLVSYLGQPNYCVLKERIPEKKVCSAQGNAIVDLDAGVCCVHLPGIKITKVAGLADNGLIKLCGVQCTFKVTYSQYSQVVGFRWYPCTAVDAPTRILMPRREILFTATVTPPHDNA